MRIFKSDLLLLLTAAIWGSAFVAQKAGLEYIGPYVFNTLRFSLGCAVLLPVILIKRKNESGGGANTTVKDKRLLLYGGIAAGILVFLGATFQQVGLIYTTAGKAGFITGLYVIIVPVIGLLWRQRMGRATWLGAIVAVAGLYLLSETGGFALSKGEAMVLICAFVWAGHVHLIGYLSPKVDPIKLAFTQFAICAIISLVISLFVAVYDMHSIRQAAVPILYAGLISVGIAYTLQVVAQRHAPPAHASIIMSLEAVFAVLGGWLILHETLTLRGILGCALMLAGMLSSAITKRSGHKLT